MDGTTNFAHNLPIFSVSIGLQKNGETIAGVVYDVMRDIMYSAELGSGAYAGSKKINVSENDRLGRSVLVTGFPYNIADNPEKAFEKFIALTKSSRGIRRLVRQLLIFVMLPAQFSMDSGKYICILGIFAGEN